MKRLALVLVLALSFGPMLALGQDSPAPKQPTVQASSADADFRKKVIEASSDYTTGKSDLNSAVKRFEDLHTEKGEDIDVQSWLGFLYLRADRASDAVPLLEKAAKARTQDLEVRTNLANAYALSKQQDLALQTYAEVIELKPSLAEPYYNRGVIFLQQKQFGKALTEFQKAAERKPDDPFILNNMGVAYDNQGDRASAADAFKKASDMRTDSKVFSRNAALALTRLRRTSDALPYWERVNKQDPSDLQAVQAMADEYFRQKNTKQALVYYEQLKDKMSGDATFWYNLGVYRDQTGNDDGAVEAYNKALAISPKDLDALNNLGLIYYRKSDFKQSLGIFEQLETLNPRSVAVKQSLGASAAKVGSTDRAIKAWKDLLKIDSTRKDIRILLGDALFGKQDLPGAETQYRSVLTTDPNNVQALNGSGLVNLKLDKLPEAEKAFRGAVKAKPTFAPGFNNLAVCLERQNKRKQAIPLLQKALAMDPNNAEIRANLQRMKAAE